MTAAADCLKGGTDINSGGTYKAEIAPGIASGVISLESARQALHNAYGFRMRLGLFDANATDKNRAIPIAAIGSAEHHQASLDAARSSLILLKNSLATGLPFQPGKKLVVVGSDVDSLAAIMEPGNYNANNICPDHHDSTNTAAVGTHSTGEGAEIEGIDTSCLSTIWQTLNATNAAAGGSATLLERSSSKGGQSWDAASIAQAVALARTADNLIVVVSDADDEGGEGRDRSSIALAKDQMAMARAVFGAVRDKPGLHSTLMTITGGVMAYDDFKDVPPSILDVSEGEVPTESGSVSAMHACVCKRRST